jgi:hypothetical protein
VNLLKKSIAFPTLGRAGAQGIGAGGDRTSIRATISRRAPIHPRVDANRPARRLRARR